ncbi:hypothetical protein KY495_22575 [Massilia sp. PAMC28688]|uniref:hypothetical protein n=1 Tax=Massilia sp. PAMC28688 TaxID=2861283 RepID=UPI001C62B77A|nr:hypothetical protein [Massilia sp. PAMC28688]QYF93417.1 hypothetical protein KY495_22575 [Massilia sp. PAMC28688]
MHAPASAAPAAVVSIEKDFFLVGSTCVHTLEEMVVALRAQQATLVALRIGDSARGSFERVGLVVYGLNRHGFTIAGIDSENDPAGQQHPTP